MGSLLIKPCKQAEIDFYEITGSHPSFQDYIPVYYGTLALNPSTNQTVSSVRSESQNGAPQAGSPPNVMPIAATATLHSRTNSQNISVPVPTTAEPWTPSGGAAIAAENNIVLENVADGFDYPNILDVKLGRRLWADDAPAAKRQKLDKASEETTSSSLGFRIAGMKVWVGRDAKEQTDGNGYRKYDKTYGRALTVTNIRKGFEDYFHLTGDGIKMPLAHKIIRLFLDDLRGLQEVLENEESRMYSASLLFVYEGKEDSLRRKVEAVESSTILSLNQSTLAAQEPNHGENLDTVDTGNENVEVPEEMSDESEGELPKVQALKMIDFAHAKWTPGQGPDENILYGIRNVIKILEGLL